MVFNFTDATRFYCYGNSVDMRKGIHSLYSLIKTDSELNALNGDGYIFISASRKSIKVIRWHNEGFILYHKKLELGLYILPQCSNDSSFFELESSVFDRMVSSVKHKSIVGDLKRNIMLSL